MNKYNKYLEVYKGIVSTENATPVFQIFQRPTVEKMLRDVGPLPEEALMFGVCPDDGLPVLLSVKDPTPQNILVLSDKRRGKTSFLKSVATFLRLSKTPYGVITNNTKEWKEQRGGVGVFHVSEGAADDLIFSLASWASLTHGKQRGRNAQAFLLFDNLEEIIEMESETIQNLRWLLDNGAKKGVWTIATIDNSQVYKIPAIVERFVTKIKGDGSYYTLQENGKEIRFYIPEME